MQNNAHTKSFNLALYATIFIEDRRNASKLYKQSKTEIRRRLSRVRTKKFTCSRTKYLEQNEEIQ